MEYQHDINEKLEQIRSSLHNGLQEIHEQLQLERKERIMSTDRLYAQLEAMSARLESELELEKSLAAQKQAPAL